jgi:nucleoside-diphosphate-sugar epimerase
MNTLIIGHRGFVGSNLTRQFPEAVGAGRKEIEGLAGSTFTDIYCAAPQAKKWWANQNPADDKQEVDNLLKACKKIQCIGSFVLFSTVDVYDPPGNVNEHTTPSSESHPYGRHRFMLEQAVLELFGERARVLRLPALVGHGLKKNIIFDLLNDNNVEQVNPNSAFQWFSLDQLSTVIRFAKNQLKGQVLNVVSEPVNTGAILDRWFAEEKARLDWQSMQVRYDVRTIHGQQSAPYLYSAKEALEFHLKPFIEAYGEKQ